MCVLKSFNGYTDDGCYENRKAYVLITNKIEGNAKFMLVILNCTLLHNQKDGWTPP